MIDHRDKYTEQVIALINDGGRLLAERIAAVLREKDIDIERLGIEIEILKAEIARLTDTGTIKRVVP